MDTLLERVKGALYGGAIGDAMGAPVEGDRWTSGKIMETFGEHDFETFLPPTHNGDPDKGKGNGRITDDTLMVEVLLNSYIELQKHLDAYDYAESIVPGILSPDTWVPEYQKRMPLFDRLWIAEKYPVIRHHHFNVDPRSGGIGNRVNCGIAMWMWPVGAVNAGDPFGAYQEAAGIGIAHNESYAVEAGAVMAGVIAAALGKNPTLDVIMKVAKELPHDGTKVVNETILEKTQNAKNIHEWVKIVQDVYFPFDPKAQKRTVHADFGPSRNYAIQEVPTALAAVLFGQDDYIETIKAAIFSGSDTDSTAGMAGSIYGAMHGVGAIPQKLCDTIDKANNRQFSLLAEKFATAIKVIYNRDFERISTRKDALNFENAMY